MDRSCKAFLIDPANRAITEATFTGDYRNINQHIDARMFEAVYLNNERDSVFIDEEGRLCEFPHKHGYFIIRGYPEVLAGRGLVLGCNEDGDSVAPKAITLEWLEHNIRFVTPTPEQVEPSIEVIGFDSGEEFLTYLYGDNK
jgi:hypothetical protein